MNALAPVAVSPADEMMAAFVAHHHVLGGEPECRRQRLAAVGAFLDDHPDLDVWMASPLDVRLVELHRRRFAWQLVSFAIVTGRCRADADFLFAKSFGPSVTAWIGGLFADDVARLCAAAQRLGRPGRAATIRVAALPVAFAGRPPSQLRVEDLDRLGDAIDSTTYLGESSRRARRGDLFRMRRLLFEAGMVDTPAQHRREGGPATREARLGAVSAVGFRKTLLAYLDVRTTVLRPKTMDKLTSALAIFGEFVCGYDPQLRSVAGLQRRHIEAFLSWTATRPGRGSQHATPRVGPYVHAHAAIAVRAFLDDITAWGWADAPRGRLVFAADIPRQPDTLPRALAPDIDTTLMAAVANLDDRFAKSGITVLRHTGLRIGELLDLELGHLVDYGTNGTWLRVPVGKLHNERSVPVDDTALEAFDEWLAQRQPHRSRPHPRDGHPADFIFVESGRRLGPTRIQRGLRDAVAAAGLTGPDGKPLRIVAHQLRHTWATELANGGISIQALMTLLGHRSPEMTIRYARLSSPTLKAAYDQAAGKIAPRIAVAALDHHSKPDRIEWLAAEMLKTRVAHGYCTREIAAEACPYANICETCPNFVTTTDFAAAIQAQLDDIRRLRDDAHQRGWTAETARHERVIASLQRHLQRLTTDTRPETTP